RMGQVVDVFGGAGEVDEFVHRLQFRKVLHLFLEQILHGLYVVVGGALDFLDPLGVLKLKVINQTVQQLIGLLGEWAYLRHTWVCCQTLETENSNLNAKTDKTVFTEYAAQAGGLAAVTAINRR